MRNFQSSLPFSFVSLLCTGLVGVLLVAYIGLIAVVMSYAVLTVEFSQSVKDDEASIATLESQYLEEITSITTMNYAAAGYVKPVTEVFIWAQSGTALR